MGKTKDFSRDLLLARLNLKKDCFRFLNWHGRSILISGLKYFSPNLSIRKFVSLR